MQYEFIPGGPDRETGKPTFAKKTVTLVDKDGATRIVTYNPTRAVNPERRARRRVCAAFGVSSGRQIRKLRKAIRRGEV